MNIPYSRQNLTNKDLFEVNKVLKSDIITQGKVVNQFELKLSKYVGSSYAVATNSATSALHVAVVALGLKKDDLFWTSPISFVASANCGIYCGAKVDFVDIDPDTFNISIYHLEKKLKQAKRTKKLPKIIIPVHMAGQSTDAKKIYELVKPYGIKILEDASHSLGGEFENKKIGCCKYSDITVFSFHPVKMITTGEGGMATTNSYKLASHMKRLTSHGVTRDQNLMTKKSEGKWYYQQIDLGWNYRLTEFQAALGISQLNRLNEFVNKRNKISLNYNTLLKNLPLKIPKVLPINKSSFHLYIIRLDKSSKHKKVFDYLRNNKILINLHYIPIHLQPYYKKMGFKSGDFPNAEEYYKRAISLPIFPGLTKQQQQDIVKKIKEIL